MISLSNRTRRALLATTAACLMLPVAAKAADDTDAKATDAGEIVVTARKVSERLQDVPISVTALSNEALWSRGAADVKDVLLTVPGLTYVGAQRGFSNYTIRGISTGAAAPTVGIYLDDISLVTLGSGFAGSIDPVFFDMQRLEVLKGPQGTLYGGSAMGGAIKYVSAKPSLTEFTGTVAGTVAGTEGGAASGQGEAVISVPVIKDTLGIRVGGYYAYDGGYIDNVAGLQFDNPRVSTSPFPTYTPLVQTSPSTFNAKNLNHTETYVGRASALLEFDGFSFQPQVYYQDIRAGTLNAYWRDRPGFQSSYLFAQPTSDRAGVYSLTAKKDFGGAELTSITAFFNRDVRYYADYSFIVGTFIPPAFGQSSDNTTTTRVRTFSQEVRLASSPSSDSKLKWLLGLYYNNQRNRMTQISFSDFIGAVLGDDLAYFGDAQTGLKQYAAFGELNYSLTDKIELTFGARAFRVEQTYNAVGDGPFNGGPTAIDRTAKENGFNPKFSVSYRATRDNLIYASATKGFRPGGPNVFAIDPTLCAVSLAQLGRTSAPTTFGSDNLWTFEIGTKNEFADRKVMFNAAAYYTRWKDIQQVFALNSCGFNFTDNAGLAEVKGVELEGRVSPLDGLTIGGNMTYNDAKITNAPLGVASRTGDRVLGTPEWAASAYADYTTPVSGRWNLTFHVDYAYQGSIRNAFERVYPVTFADGPNTIPNPAEFRASYNVVNASVLLSNGAIQLRAFGNNLSNARPLIDQDSTYGIQRASTIRPRTYGLAARYSF